MSFDYTGSFSGSFYGVISSSAQVNYGQLQNRPITITAFQRNSITANNNFRENTWPYHSSSFDARIKTLTQSSGSVTFISGSDGIGNNIDTSFAKIIFDVSSGLYITSSNGVDVNVSFTLDTSSQHFIDAVTNIAGNGGSGGGIFAPTGSVQSTTNDLEVTGSMTIHNGLFKLSEFQTLPNAEGGAIAYSASQFWFGVD